MMPSNHLILCCLLLLPLSVFPSIREELTLHIRWPNVLELQLQHQSFQWIFRTDFLKDWQVWSPCSPRDSQESSLTPQFKNINSSVLSFLNGPTLTSIHDYWKNLNFNYTDLCWQSNVSAFYTQSRFVTVFLARSKHLLIPWLQSLSTVIDTYGNLVRIQSWGTTACIRCEFCIGYWILALYANTKESGFINWYILLK